MRYENGCVTVSVGGLCELLSKRGDLDLRASAGISRMNEGLGAHRKLQSERMASDQNYKAEVRLSHACEHGGVGFEVSGIADGISDDGENVTVEEIKTVTGRMPSEPYIVHLAQLRAYAYFYAVDRDLGNIHLRLTYYNDETSRSRSFEYDESKAVLGMYFDSLLDIALPTAKQLKYRAEGLLPAIKEKAVFPYGELRTGQDDLITECYRAIKRGMRLFAQAPTGIGKTLSVLYPASRAVADRHCDKIFYLTAKAATRREAFEAMRKLFEHGSKLRTCVITARDSCCALAEARENGRISSFCNPVDCKYAAGYYDRAQNAVMSLLGTRNGFSRTAIAKAAEDWSVCPYELSLDLSEFCDVVICDYNYVFDPGVYFRRYFGPTAESGDFVFLIDEAHNLPDRVRSMYSCELRRSDFEELYAVAAEVEPEIAAAAEKVINYLTGLRELCSDNIINASDGERGFYMSRTPLPDAAKVMKEFTEKTDSWRKAGRDHPLYGTVSSRVTDAKKYLVVSEMYDEERYLTYYEMMGGNARLRVFCLDPSEIIGRRLGMARASVLFSATLTPLDYFTSLCGSDKDAVTLDLPSPFPEGNLCLAAVDTLSTRADDRDDKVCRKIATYIAATVSAKAGNYICYFPSYDFMERVHAAFSRKYDGVVTVIQKKGMTISEREDFLSAFKDDAGVLRVGFCVLGGSFSEGVDLPGNRLIGSIVIGAGIPGISNERNILRDYYDLRTEQNGYDYAYTYPGMNAVLQAVGRVIRRDTDRGIAVLIDDRYGTPQYAAMFPEQWSGLQFAGNPASLAEIARRFWNNKDKSK